MAEEVSKTEVVGIEVVEEKKQDGGAFSRFKSFSEDQLTYIQDQLSRGGESMAIARVIQEEWGMFKDVAQKTLHQQLSRYKTFMVQGNVAGKEVRSGAGAALVKATRKRDKLDVLERMSALFDIQETRLQMFLDKEAQLKMPLTGIDTTVKDMMSMLKDIQKTRFDLGMDQFYGVITGGGSSNVRSATKTVVSPDGSITTVNLLEAVTTADSILSRASISIDAVEVPSGS